MKQPKRHLPDSEDNRSPKRLKTNHDEALTEDKRVDDGNFESNMCKASKDDKSNMAGHENSTPSPEHAAETHDHGILPTIEDDSQHIPTIPGRDTMSPKEILESASDDEDTDSSPPPDGPSSPSSTFPIPSPPSLSAFLHHDASPRSSATASPVPSPSRSRGDSSPSSSLPGTPFSSYTSISEGDSDSHGNDPENEEDWPEVANVNDLNDQDSDDYRYDSDSDDDDHSVIEDEEDEPEEDEDEGFGMFASRYTRWPDFDGPVHGDEYTHVIIKSKEKDAAEWDSGSDPLHEGPRYPGMDAFRLVGYYPFDHWSSEAADQEAQEPEDTFYLGDDDDDDGYDQEWAMESDSKIEAEWWGGGMWIIRYT